MDVFDECLEMASVADIDNVNVPVERGPKASQAWHGAKEN